MLLRPSQDNAKVADFGESRRFNTEAADEEDDKGLTMTVVGTPMYCECMALIFAAARASEHF